MVKENILRGEPVQYAKNLSLVNNNRAPVSIALSASPLLDQEKEVVGCVIIIRDTTIEQQMEERLRQSEKMQALGQLAIGVAHDFNNMYGGIVGATELLDPSVAGQEKNISYRNMIRTAWERASGLTSKLLAFSWKGGQVSTAMNIHQLIEECITLLERSIDNIQVLPTITMWMQCCRKGWPVL